MNALRSHELLDRNSSRLLVVDVQEKLVALFPADVQQRFVETCCFVCEGAKLFGVPTTITEQYPQGLGPTVAKLAEYAPDRIAKQCFSAVECTGWPPAAENDRFQAVVIGMETHVCILQTVLNLIAAGYQTYVVVDSLAARGAVDHEVAIQRMANSGAILTTAESVLFQWCESSAAPEFKQFSKLLKQRQA